jgi:hypothetical protein
MEARTGTEPEVGQLPSEIFTPEDVRWFEALYDRIGLAQGFPVPEIAVIFLAYPPGFGVELGAVYAFWLAIVLALYPACRWFAGVKARRREWWLQYL